MRSGCQQHTWTSAEKSTASRTFTMSLLDAFAKLWHIPQILWQTPVPRSERPASASSSITAARVPNSVDRGHAPDFPSFASDFVISRMV